MSSLFNGRPIREASRGPARPSLPPESGLGPLSDLVHPSTRSASSAVENPAVASVAPNGESRLLRRMAGLLSGGAAAMAVTGAYFMLAGAPLYGGYFVAAAVAAQICARQIGRLATDFERSPADR